MFTDSCENFILTDTVVPKEGINHEPNSIFDEEGTPEKTRLETLYDNAESDTQVDAPFHKNTNKLLSANKEGNNQDKNLTSAEEGTPDSRIVYDNAESDIQVNAPFQKNTNQLLSANK
ncbi:uncharacterized protein LOC112465075, partial [Temnothorax curvispinosus]|uniref:Uncharacterized protein LOC112465075 n=1 Tax=Temnothorax curvispinosus TaxID=300111 RepID=A0A6J1QZR6_9HYME